MNRTRTRYVYAVRANDKIKIGWSSDLKRRYSELQVGQAYKLVPVATWPDNEATKMEKMMHAILDPYRVRGEWFECSDDDVINAWDLAQMYRPARGGWPAWAAAAAEHGLSPVPKNKYNFPSDRPNPVGVLGLPIGTQVAHVGFPVWDVEEENLTFHGDGTWAGHGQPCHIRSLDECAGCGKDVYAEGLFPRTPIYVYGWSTPELDKPYGAAVVCVGCVSVGSWPVNSKLAVWAHTHYVKWQEAAQLLETSGQFTDWVEETDPTGELMSILSPDMAMFFPFLTSLMENGRARGYLTPPQLDSLLRWWPAYRDKWAADWELPARFQGDDITEIMFECFHNCQTTDIGREQVAHAVAFMDWRAAGNPRPFDFTAAARLYMPDYSRDPMVLA